MSLKGWLTHRMELVGIDSVRELAGASGVGLGKVRRLFAGGGLDELQVSQKRGIAKVLHVSFKMLLRLDAGEIAWIEDSHVYFTDRQPRAKVNDPTEDVPKLMEDLERGTPVIGFAWTATGKAEADEAWEEEYGRRIPPRYKASKEVYAMEVDNSQKYVVFRNKPFWCAPSCKEGVVIEWDVFDGKGHFGLIITSIPGKTLLKTGAGERKTIDAEQIVRYGELIDRYPKAESEK